MSEEQVPTATTSSEPLETGRDAESALDIPAKENSNTLKISEPLDERNWVIWKERMKLTLRLCGLEGYAEGVVKNPEDPVKAKYWMFNDCRTQFMIVNNITSPQMVNISQCATTQKMWTNLQAVHEEKSHYSTIANIRGLLHTSADENANLSDHLTTLKTYWERINLNCDHELKLSDRYFKVIILSSLPPSWDVFAEPYVGGSKGEEEKDLKKLTSSQEFIGVIREEATCRLSRAAPITGSANQPVAVQATIVKPPLAKRIGAPYIPNRPPPPKKMFCRQCSRTNHSTANCIYLGMDKCDECGRFGHLGKNCWSKKNKKRKNNYAGPSQAKVLKKQKQVEMNSAVEECIVAMEKESANEIIIGEADEELIVFSAVGDEDKYGLVDVNEINVSLLQSDWLADSATTSHITNERDLLIEYTPTPNLTVVGVGGNNTAVKGRGTVVLHTECGDRRYKLRLENVLYIPTNKNNLLSLGRWEGGGRQYIGANEELKLYDADGYPIATGHKIKQSLYKMDISECKRIKEIVPASPSSGDRFVFTANTDTQTWETWHK